MTEVPFATEAYRVIRRGEKWFDSAELVAGCGAEIRKKTPPDGELR